MGNLIYPRKKEAPAKAASSAGQAGAGGRAGCSSGVLAGAPPPAADPVPGEPSNAVRRTACIPDLEGADLRHCGQHSWVDPKPLLPGPPTRFPSTAGDSDSKRSEAKGPPQPGDLAPAARQPAPHSPTQCPQSFVLPESRGPTCNARAGPGSQPARSYSGGQCPGPPFIHSSA